MYGMSSSGYDLEFEGRSDSEISVYRTPHLLLVLFTL